MRILLIFAAIICLTIPSAYAELASYTHTVDVTPEDTRHTIEVRYFNDSGAVRLFLPPQLTDLVVSINDQEAICVQTQQVGFTEITCAKPVGVATSYAVRATFSTTYPLIKIDHQLLVRSEFRTAVSSTQSHYIVKFPEGYIIPSSKPVSFYVQPTAYELYSDGQHVILRWDRTNLTTFELSVLMEPLPPSRSTGTYVVIGLAILALGIAGYVLWHRGHTDSGVIQNTLTNPHSPETAPELSDTHASLVDHERIVVDLLKRAPHHTLWQKQIQHASSFSKVKLSRVIRSLEQRGVVSKEPYGNTNKIKLVTNKEKSPPQEPHDTNNSI